MDRALDKRCWVAVVLPLAGSFAFLLAGCGGDDKHVNTPGGPQVRSTVVSHEPCEGGGRAEAIDVNGDGKPDVTKVFQDGRELCRVTDLNHDGKVDLFEYFGPGGETRRREASYVESGDITSIEYFEGGKRVRRELDTTGQRRIDTWDYFDAGSGLRTKRERDLNGDGRIDQWWEWQGDKVTIALDRTGDGLPDPEATIVQGADGKLGSGLPGAPGGGPAAAPSASAAPAASPPPEPKPTEVKPADVKPADVKPADAKPADAKDKGSKDTKKTPAKGGKAK